MSFSTGVLARGNSRLARVGAAPAARQVECMLERIGRPSLEVVLWDGTLVGAGATHPRFRVTLHRRSALLRLLADPEFALPEC